MIVSKSNFASDATITVSPESEEQDINVISDGDYSSTFTQAMDGTTTITFEFDTPRDIGYIAIGGSNISQKTSLTVTSIDESDQVLLQSSDGFLIDSSDGFSIGFEFTSDIDDSTLGMSESNVMMYQLDITQSSKVEFTVTGSGTLIVSEIAIGEYYEIPRSQQAGYAMPWSVPNVKSRNGVNLQNAPISLSYESRAISTSITVPNNIAANYDDGWYDFIKYATLNTFYVLEDDNKFHSYAGFNAEPTLSKNHSQTRALYVSGIKFNAFAKSTEGLY